MRKKIIMSLVLLACLSGVRGQSIIMNKGFEDLQLGISESRLDEIVGFHGKSLTKEEYFNTEAAGRTKDKLPEFKKGFDHCLIYKHIMPIPVTRVFLKAGKVVMIEINSYPDFTRPICLDSKTREGLKFWDTKEMMEKIYGKAYRTDVSPDGLTQYIYFDTKGIGFGLTNNEIRIIYYY